MSGVQRFSVKLSPNAKSGRLDYEGMIPHEVGAYVQYDDFARVSAELAAAREELAALRRDAERLDWLDASNLTMRMGWNVGKAPAGNVSIRSVIYLGKEPVCIRAAIDAALQESRE